MEKKANLLYNSNGDSMDKKHTYGIQIIKQLQSHGYEAYFVGGYVRDYILKIPTKDIDITTDAKTHEVMPLFEKVVLTGEKYGTVTVIINGYSFEVTTYRSEATYSDSRHPDEVQFVTSLKEDLARRDFTINQLVMDSDLNILDHYGGREDIKCKRIRTIGAPKQRFEEDALRILRAFRFVAKLGFTIEEQTLNAIYESRYRLQHVAIERIQDELTKLFNQSHKQKAIDAMLSTAIDKALPDLLGDLKILKNIQVPYFAEDAFAALFIENLATLSHFKFSKKAQRTYKDLYNIYYQTKDAPFQPEHLFQFGKALCLKVNQIHRMLDNKDHEKTIHKLDQTLPIRRVCELAFKGEDIIEAFELENRKYIGLIIDHLLLEVLHNRVPNTYEALKAAATKYIKTILKEI